MFYICTRNDASATVGCSSAKAKQARLRTHHLARQLQRHSKDKVLLLRKKGRFNLGKRPFFSEKAKRTLRVSNWDVAPRNHPKATGGRGKTTQSRREPQPNAVCGRVQNTFRSSEGRTKLAWALPSRDEIGWNQLNKRDAVTRCSSPQNDLWLIATVNYLS